MANNTPFDPAWRRLHKSSLFYWELLQELPADILRQQPEPNRWSLLQIAEHLAGAEDSALQYLQRKQCTPLKSKSILPAQLRALLLKLSLKSPLKFKAPPVLAQPTNTTDAISLLTHWQQTRKDLENYLGHLPADKKNALLFRHPVAGPLNLQQTLEFMADHLDHHRPQAQRLIAR